jgi:hypothetical protein
VGSEKPVDGEGGGEEKTVWRRHVEPWPGTGSNGRKRCKERTRWAGEKTGWHVQVGSERREVQGKTKNGKKGF